MYEPKIMRLVASKDELIGGDYVRPFTIDGIIIFAFICIKNVWMRYTYIVMYLCRYLECEMAYFNGCVRWTSNVSTIHVIFMPKIEKMPLCDTLHQFSFDRFNSLL